MLSKKRRQRNRRRLPKLFVILLVFLAFTAIDHLELPNMRVATMELLEVIPSWEQEWRRRRECLNDENEINSEDCQEDKSIYTISI